MIRAKNAVLADKVKVLQAKTRSLKRLLAKNRRSTEMLMCRRIGSAASEASSN